MDALIAADKETILGIHEIGEKIAEQCIKHFSEAANINIINQLKDAGLNFEIVEEVGQETTNKLEGKSFLVSGTFSISRDDLKKMIELNGGRNVSGISKSLNYLISGDKMGPEKLKKATDLNIPIISETEFLEMLN
jgi:DNA ligase (NAD+)